MLSPTKLPSVPEEYHPSDDFYRSLNTNYEEVSAPSYFSQPASSVMNTTSSVAVSTNDENQKMYIKLEQEQPLQLSVTQELNQKGTYRNGNNLYHQEPNTPPVYTQNNITSYSAYPTQNYSQQSNQSSHHSAHNSMVVNYTHQMNNK